MKDILISGFADEIAPEFDRQLAVVKHLGMHFLSLRGADGKNIADYSYHEARERLLPRLEAAGVGVSSLGTPIGKLDLDDEAGFQRQLGQMKTLCQIALLLSCRYLRVFSFYLPADGGEQLALVAQKVGRYIELAEEYGVTLVLENEKGVFGDTGSRCRALLDRVGSPVCRAAFDFANFVQCGEDPQICWDLLKAKVAYIHIKDAVSAHAENVLCGTGEGKIAQILRQAIQTDGYRGFLTLEPHLVAFEGLQGLERGGAPHVTGRSEVRDGADGYAQQYFALCKILNEIKE